MSSPLPSSFDGNRDFYEENRWQKFSRRLKEEPLIPLGCALTCFALLGATRSIRAGDHNRTNRMFRARIYAQGFTLVAMLAGSAYWQSDREKRKEFDTVLAEKKAKEKNDAWIKELEARDEEAKQIRSEREARRQGLSLPAVAKENRNGVKAEAERTVDSIQNSVEGGKGASSTIDENEKKKGVFESVQSLVWGKKN